MNDRRELENRLKEEEMKKAIEEWRRRDKDEFRALVQEKQVGVLLPVIFSV